MTPQKRALVLAFSVALAIPAEGIRRVWYADPVSIVTVCYGHTGPDVDKSKVYSIEECKSLLNKDMNHAIDIVDRCVPGLPPPVLAAFADAEFNIGGGKIACDTTRSTAARMLKAGDYAGACRQLVRWDQAKVLGVMVALPGLTKRRAMERDLCLSGVSG